VNHPPQLRLPDGKLDQRSKIRARFVNIGMVDAPEFFAKLPV
jgi:hypothetical protein